MNTAWEQLEGAALALARSGSIKDRLAEAYRNHLALVNVDELPQSLRAQFQGCQEALTREPPLRGEDAVRATVRKMSSLEADELACSVVHMFAEIVRESARAAVLEQAAAESARASLMEHAAAEPACAAPAAVVAARGKRKAVPQVISLYAAEVAGQSSLNSMVSQRVVSS
jgi:hypothetical protein